MRIVLSAYILLPGVSNPNDPCKQLAVLVAFMGVNECTWYCLNLYIYIHRTRVKSGV